jgi:hypothetical protein
MGVDDCDDLPGELRAREQDVLVVFQKRTGAAGKVVCRCSAFPKFSIKLISFAVGLSA